MISLRHIVGHIAAEPFRPFRITLIGGRTIDIYHPDMVRAGRSKLLIDTFFDAAGEPAEREVVVPFRVAESVGPIALNLSRQEPPMLSSTQALAYAKAEPFRPFRLHMVSGRTFDIRHPEMIKVAKNFALVFSFAPGDDEFAERFDTVSLLLVESVSYTDAPVSS